MPNHTGKNGYDNGTVPPEEDLVAALKQYAREQLTMESRLQRLAAELNYHIRHTKLKQLNTKYGVPTSRKPPSLVFATTAVCEKMAQDPDCRHSPTTIKKLLALDGIHIPRSMVRAIMHDNDTLGAVVRNPRAKTHPKVS